MSVFHQHSRTTLKYCSNVIYESGDKLGWLRSEIGALVINYRINKPSKPLWKINKLTFTKIYWSVLEATLKSKQPFTLPYNLSPPLQPHHITNTSGHCLPISCVDMSSPLIVMLVIFLSTFNCIYFKLTFLSRGTSLVATECHVMHTTWNGLINHSVDW